MTISKDERDRNYVCAGCGGNLVVIAIREENGRKIYNCDSCHKNKCLECTMCHKPRSIWADDGDICGLCGLEYLRGNLSFTPAQIASIEKWRVAIQLNQERRGLKCQKFFRYLTWIQKKCLRKYLKVINSYLNLIFPKQGEA